VAGDLAGGTKPRNHQRQHAELPELRAGDEHSTRPRRRDRSVRPSTTGVHGHGHTASVGGGLRVRHSRTRDRSGRPGGGRRRMRSRTAGSAAWGSSTGGDMWAGWKATTRAVQRPSTGTWTLGPSRRLEPGQCSASTVLPVDRSIEKRVINGDAAPLTGSGRLPHMIKNRSHPALERLHGRIDRRGERRFCSEISLVSNSIALSCPLMLGRLKIRIRTRLNQTAFLIRRRSANCLGRGK